MAAIGLHRSAALWPCTDAQLGSLSSKRLNHKFKNRLPCCTVDVLSHKQIPEAIDTFSLQTLNADGTLRCAHAIDGRRALRGSTGDVKCCSKAVTVSNHKMLTGSVVAAPPAANSPTPDEPLGA